MPSRDPGLAGVLPELLPGNRAPTRHHFLTCPEGTQVTAEAGGHAERHLRPRLTLLIPETRGAKTPPKCLPKELTLELVCEEVWEEEGVERDRRCDDTSAGSRRARVHLLSASGPMPGASRNGCPPGTNPREGPHGGLERPPAGAGGSAGGGRAGRGGRGPPCREAVAGRLGETDR